MNINLKKEVNPHFYTLLEDRHRFLVLRGGGGSGKSYFCAQKILYRIMKDWNEGFKHRFLVLRKTLPYARKSVFPLVREYIYKWGLQGECSINRTECVITFSNGSEIIFSGLDESEKLKSIHGLTGAWLEEATEFGVEDFRQLNLRLRGKIPTYFQIMISFNPISELNWVYKEFFMGFGMAQNRRKNTYLDFSTYKDNTFIDEAYKKELQALEDIDYMWYKIYCLGEWGSLENLIFKKWSYVKEFPTDLQEVVCGCDFGFTHNSALVLLGIGKEGIYAKELLYKKKQTTAMLATRMLEVIPDVPYARNVLNRETPIYCDSARPDSIAELRKSGLNVIPAAKGADSVMAGINCIKQHKLFVTEDSTNIVKELQTYKWKENKEGQVFDEPVKLNDDLVDAMRYAAYMTLRRKKELLVCFANM